MPNASPQTQRASKMKEKKATPDGRHLERASQNPGAMPGRTATTSSEEPSSELSPEERRMGRCEVCGNTYDKSFTITMGGKSYLFDSFECAIHALAPSCDH